MINIIYEKITGNIVLISDILKDPLGDRSMSSEIYDYITISKSDLDIKHKKIIDGVIIDVNEIEKQDINKYGRILTNDERLLYSLKPSREEVLKAENTIEILEILSEVL